MSPACEVSLNNRQLAAWAASCVCFQSCWALTVGFVPGRMQQLGANELLIGLLLSIPPIVSLGELYFGARGDKRVQHGGSRYAYLIWGALFCAAGGFLMVSQGSLLAFTAGLLLLWFGCSAYESNQLALLSEKIPQTQRTKSLSLSVMFRSMLSLIYFIGIPLYLSTYAISAPYLIAATLIPAAMLITVYGLPRHNISISGINSKNATPRRTIKYFFASHFLWTFSIQAIVVFFQLFLINELLTDDIYTDKENTATLIMGAVPLSGLFWAALLPILCKRIGLKQCICLCVALILPVCLLCFIAKTIAIIIIAELLAGLIFVGLAALPMSLLTQLQNSEKAGAYAAYFSIAIVAAQISASVIIGISVEYTENYRIIFPIAASSAVLALLVFSYSFLIKSVSAPNHE